MTYLPNFQVASPLLALGAGALVVLLLDLLLPARRAQYAWFAATLGALVVSAWYTVSLWPAPGGQLAGFGGALLSDRFGLVINLVILAAAFGTVLLSLHRREEDISGYLALVLWAAMGMMVLAMAGSLMTVFLGLEILSLALYVLVAFRSGHDVAREGALKYFVLGSMAAGFMLFGFALVYGSVGHMGLREIARWVAEQIQAGGPVPMYLKVGTGLALVGYAFKLALVPFHVWAPDVYQGAPTAVTAFMSVGTKSAAFVALVRFLLAITPGWADRAVLPLVALAGLSMLVGSLGAMRQTNLKRLLAYSGIASAGYLFMGLPGLTQNGVGAH